MEPPKWSFLRVIGVIGLIILVSVLCLLAVLAAEGRDGPLHHMIARSFLGYPPQRAVDAFEAHDWETALREARTCVSLFRDAGIREQSRLESEHVPAPSPGRTTDKEMRDIMRRGAVNSLAHCSFLEAEAARRMDRSAEALRAYENTARLTYGRVYDHRTHWFWSPAERVADVTALVDSSRP